MAKQKAASYESAAELMAAYIKYRDNPTGSLGNLECASRRYCYDVMNRGNFVCPDPSKLPRDIAVVCRRIISEINKKNGEVARRLLAKMP
jgi:hypothetical protein